MKHASRITLLLLAGLLTSLGTALAQEKPPAGLDPIAAQLFPPELVMRFQSKIGMEQEQKDQLRKVVAEAQVSFIDLQWNLHDASQQLVDLLSATHPDEAAVLEQLGLVLDAERKVKQEQIRLLVRIKNILTPAQQSQLRELRPAGSPPAR
jgi:Spy/CpxP family protein refolding chaperone